MSSNTIGILIILGIISIALFGGVKKNNYAFEQKIQETKNQVDNLKTTVQTEEDKKTQSKYKDLVTLAYVNRSTDQTQEYATIRVNYNTKENIPVTGWILHSVNSGNSVTIPKATYLFFAGIANTEDNIILTADDTLYLVTGISPNGASFKVNKCSGYLSQFQTFVPYLNNNCPAPRNEDLSGIPKTSANDRCFDYIDSMSSCRIQIETPSQYLGAECNDFITKKINYPSCVDTHRSDKDFYQPEWRVYLKRGQSLWKDRRETIVLYDNDGKIVDSLTY